MEIEYFEKGVILSPGERESVSDFLHTALGEYGDPREDIAKAIDHAMGCSGRGGVVVVGRIEERIVGAVVINKTGMQGYMPENLLVYIAIDALYRGQGLGRELMVASLGRVDGDVALHVEPQNPALRLYQSLGFVNKYLEMRLVRKGEPWPISH